MKDREPGLTENFWIAYHSHASHGTVPAATWKDGPQRLPFVSSSMVTAQSHGHIRSFEMCIEALEASILARIVTKFQDVLSANAKQNSPRLPVMCEGLTSVITFA